MSTYMIGPHADLSAIEAAVWVGNMKRVANESLGGYLPDAQTGGMVDISTLTDEQINDRDRFPLPNIIRAPADEGGAVISVRAGNTLRWDVPHEVTNPSSPHFGSYYLPLPAPGQPYDAETTALLLDAMRTVATAYPSVSEVDVSIDDLREPVTEEI